MFQAPDLNLIVEFIFMFYKEKPIDWLLDHILWVKVCNPEKDAVCTLITTAFDLIVKVSYYYFRRNTVSVRSPASVYDSGPPCFNMWDFIRPLPGRSKSWLWALWPPSYLFAATFEAASFRELFDFMSTVGQRLLEATAAQDACQSPSWSFHVNEGILKKQKLHIFRLCHVQTGLLD